MMTPNSFIFFITLLLGLSLSLTSSYSITKISQIVTRATQGLGISNPDPHNNNNNYNNDNDNNNRRIANFKSKPNFVINTKLFASNKVEVDDSTAEKKAKYSFVNDDLRTYAMKLHTKSQAPREGQAPEKPQMPYEPTRANYLSFLVDSLKVYETFEEIIKANSVLKPFEDTGLDRSAALRTDIAWMAEYDKSLVIPQCGAAGEEYSALLKDIIKESVPKFMCHYYNHYFAHTAGGLMIGKRLSAKLLEGHTLDFYKWDGDVKEYLSKTKDKVDTLANTWSPDEKEACMTETMGVFKYSGGLMVYFRAPTST